MAEDNPSPNQIKQLETRLDYLEFVASQAVARLFAIENHLGLLYRTPSDLERTDQLEREPPPLPLRDLEEGPKRTAPPSYAVMQEASGQTPPPASRVSGLEPTQPELHKTPVIEADHQGLPESSPQPPIARPGPAAPSITPSTFSPRRDLESRIGGNWFNRIGIVAIFLGVTFFLKYAVDNQWIGPAGRVLMGAAVGAAFLILGERLRTRYSSYAYGLTGGGIAVLYATIWFASGNKYGLLSQSVAFGLMAVVTATASLLSARYNALPIAVLGLIGGFLTPILLASGVDNQAGLFTYIALLDLGVLALAYSKRWRSLNYLAFISTVLMSAAWLSAWYSADKLGTTIFFLTLLFAIFALLAVLYNVIQRRPTRWLDLAMVFSNALLYFGTTYDLLEDNHQGVLGLFALLISVFYAGLGYITYNRHLEDRLLIFTFLGLAFLFAVLAVPIQFDQHWVTMGWAIQGAVMSWVGLRANDRTSRYAALVVFGVAVAHWFDVDMQEFASHANESFLPLLNRRALSSAVIVAALAATVGLYKRTRTDVTDEERSMFIGLYLLGANAMAVILLSLEVNDYFNQKAGAEAAGAEGDRVDSSRYFTITALWSIYGAAALIVGIQRKLKLIRAAALVLLAAAIVFALSVNLSYYDAFWHSLVFNQTFGSFLLLVGALVSGAWFYSKAQGIDDNERKVALFGLIGSASVLALIALSTEALGYFDRAQSLANSEIAAQLENTKQLALTAVWTIYGAVALIIGLRRRATFVRIGALMLLALATIKVVVVDSSFYDASWHTLIFNQTFGAFAFLIGALSSTVWAYTRGEKISARERSNLIPVLVASANVLAILALSLEAFGHYAVQLRIAGLTPQQVANLRLAQQLSISVVWAIYGGVMLTVGIARRSKLLRVMALWLLGLTIFKVFLIDLSSLEKLYRIISFIVLGAILLAVSFLYQRYRQRMAVFIGDGDPTEPGSSE